MKLRWGLLAAFLTMVGASAAQAAEWKTYRYPVYGFAAEYPTEPAPQDQKIDPKRLVKNIQYWSDLGEVAYGVNAALFQHNIIAGQPAPKQIQSVLEGVRGSLKCTVRSQRPIKFPGGTGIEVIFDKCPAPLVDAKQRILIVGDWLYQLLVLGSKGGVPESPDTKRFLESFSVVAQ
jgi:hypothetical protein